ncbi:M20 family metallopeptidase [Fusibacter sp. 3D3]|uniref:M20 metallopeptidase family protein n=1 Tax=Fusibacter sp. 3D3 TaxID=1048380 RepID=UPI000852F9C9|nr:M20 family metallopeptidase [Fusibacter sp. 3D3]GAU75925.1 N-acetyl-L,L-diaminopimelate deacetylase [Fusibacter sp. 3D3]
MKALIKKKIDDFSKELIDIRRYFHQYPELMFEEYETSKKISELLTSWGIENKTISKTGVVGLIRGSRPGKTIAVRADIDALPIDEETELAFSSKNKGRMHACGHDGHIAMGLGTAKILSELKDHFNGNVKFIFQPAEEMPGGAGYLIKEGVLENPKVDAIIGLHIWPDMEKGYIGISKGPLMSAVDKFDVEVIGKGGHGAFPNKAIDPIVVGSQIITALQSIVSREIDPFDCVVLSSCAFNSGNVFNVIPEKANITGTIRYFNKAFSEYIPKRMEEIISGITIGFRCNYKFEYTQLCPVVVNDRAFTNFFENGAKEIMGSEKVIEIERPAMGGEDFSFYLEKVPGTFFFLGTKDEKNGISKSLHHPQYNFSEEILSAGVELFANTVVNYLNKI